MMLFYPVSTRGKIIKRSNRTLQRTEFQKKIEKRKEGLKLCHEISWEN